MTRQSRRDSHALCVRQAPARIIVANEHHFLSVRGRVFAASDYSYSYWCEYLNVFEEVAVIARIGESDAVPDGWVRADGENVRFHAVYDYLGFWQFLRRLPRVFRDCRAAMKQPGAILFRMGNIGQLCWLNLASGRPYAFEGLGHAGESAARVEHVRRIGLGQLIGFLEHRFCRRLARGAGCANYISHYVARLYPTRASREFVISDVHLPEDAFGQPRTLESFGQAPLKLVTLGRLVPEKACDVLLEAVADLCRRGRDVRCEFIGAGPLLDSLRHQADALSIGDRIVFHGQVEQGQSVRSILCRSDLFVLPSLTEGLGRALLEAMALGLPAIGSDTGGIPELLPPQCLVRPGNVRDLADKVDCIGHDVAELVKLSADNIKTAGLYESGSLRRKRHEFWTQIHRQYETYAAT